MHYNFQNFPAYCTHQVPSKKLKVLRGFSWETLMKRLLTEVVHGLYTKANQAWAKGWKQCYQNSMKWKAKEGRSSNCCQRCGTQTGNEGSIILLPLSSQLLFYCQSQSKVRWQGSPGNAVSRRHQILRAQKRQTRGQMHLVENGE